MNHAKFMEQIKERLREVETLAAGGASVQAAVAQVQSDIQAELTRAEKMLAERHAAHAVEHQRRVAEARARVEAAKKSVESTKPSARDIIARMKLERNKSKAAQVSESAPAPASAAAAAPPAGQSWSTFLDDSQFKPAASSLSSPSLTPADEKTPPKPDPDKLSWSKFIHD